MTKHHPKSQTCESCDHKMLMPSFSNQNIEKFSLIKPFKIFSRDEMKYSKKTLANRFSAEIRPPSAQFASSQAYKPEDYDLE